MPLSFDRQRNIRVLCLLASVVVALGMFFGVPAQAQDSGLSFVEIEPSGGRELPSFRFTTKEGQQVELKEVEGALTILHFWATWCAPCLEELPLLNKKYEELRLQHVTVVPISLDNVDKAEKVSEFYQRNHIQALPVYFGDQVQLLSQMKLVGMPTTIFVKDGKELGRANGALDWQGKTLQKYIEQKLKLDAPVF